jgi:hypothetical protein
MNKRNALIAGLTFVVSSCTMTYGSRPDDFKQVVEKSDGIVMSKSLKYDKQLLTKKDNILLQVLDAPLIHPVVFKDQDKLFIKRTYDARKFNIFVQELSNLKSSK